MNLFLSIQCIYKVRKSGKKTNRCQKINVQKLFNNRLQIEINLINLTDVSKTVEKYLNHQSERVKSRANINTKF